MFFVAQTLSGQEWKVKKEFENNPDLSKLGRVEIVSKLTEIQLENGKTDKKQRNLFPEYVFIEIEEGNLKVLKLAIELGTIRGIVDILHTGECYTPLTNTETDALGLTGGKKIRKGSKVVITARNGFENEEGKVVKIEGKDYYVLVENYTLKLRENDFVLKSIWRESK